MANMIYELSLDLEVSWKEVTQDLFLWHLIYFPVVESKEKMIGRLIGGETLRCGIVALRMSPEPQVTEAG